MLIKRFGIILSFALMLTLSAVPALGQWSTTLYDNGPINGTIDAWTINYGYAVSDSFSLWTSATITGFQFGVWAYPSDTPQTVDFAIGTSPFGGTFTTVPLQSEFLYNNQYGYDIDLETVSNLNIFLEPGEYWLTLQNAVTTQGQPLYWDENSGASQAQESSLGTIPSESFQILGVTSSTTGCGVAGGGASPNCYPPVPEPGTLVLLGSGLLGLGAIMRRKLRL